MRPSNSVWQGNFGYWQNSFIHNNLLVIGYTAWKGFQSFGQGAVLCDVDTQVTQSTITNFDTVPFTLQFLPCDLIGLYLRSQSLIPILYEDAQNKTLENLCPAKKLFYAASHKFGINSSIISSIFPAVATYNPHEDILLVLKVEPQIEVTFLHQLKITPPDCYEQVCKRWSEFQPSLMP